MRAQYLETESQKIYNIRMQKIELPFGHLKRNLHVESFLLRGLKGVKAEMALRISSFFTTYLLASFVASTLVAMLSVASSNI